MLSHASFIDLCEQELRLCAVAQGETLVVVSQGDERAGYADAFLAAAARLGATGFQIRLPESTLGIGGDVGVWTVGATPLAGNRAAVEALKQADIVIDVMFLLHSKELVEIQRSGTRILTCIEPIDILTRLFPTRELAGRVQRAVELLAAASTLRVTSAAGTDVAYRLGAYTQFGQYGFADKPGHWDHWSSSGMAYTYGADDGVDGTVVVAPGDILLPFKTYVQAPIELTIEAGRIREIRGGVDADVVREYMENFGDPDAYGLAHIGWAMNENAKWTALATDRRGHGMESRGFAGNVLFSTGPNTQAGGPNNTHCHLDIPMRSCSLSLDDRPIVVDGEVVADELRPAGAPAILT
jgi:2,5-dihydroxypyridine 5,6-dioxygenase